MNIQLVQKNVINFFKPHHCLLTAVQHADAVWCLWAILNMAKPISQDLLGFDPMPNPGAQCLETPRKSHVRDDEGKSKTGRAEKKVRKRMEEKRTPSVSHFKTTANKSQGEALLEGDAWIISLCQFKWLPVSPLNLLLFSPSFPLSPYLVMSHCIFQYILLQTCGGWGGVLGGGCGVGDVGGCYRCERNPPPSLDKWAFRADDGRMGMKINLI